MGCGTASTSVNPVGLGRGKCVKSWDIHNLGSNQTTSYSIDVSECEEEGMIDVGPLEKAFQIHCNFLITHYPKS